MDIKLMISVVQAYIHHLKEVNVDINLNQFQNPLNVIKLKQSYDIAMDFFRNNNGQINQI